MKKKQINNHLILLGIFYHLADIVNVIHRITVQAVTQSEFGSLKSLLLFSFQKTIWWKEWRNLSIWFELLFKGGESHKVSLQLVMH